VPFFALLTHPGKRSRAVVGTVCSLLLISRVADRWWLVLPEFPQAGPLWLDAAALLTLGGLTLLLFFWGLRYPGAVPLSALRPWKTHDG
jgi:hypothetical protein